MSSRKKFIIIDGFNFLFRAYYAVRPLTREDGLPTNALYGFTQMLLKVVSDINPDLCVVAVDSKTNFRNDIYPEYKANRKEPDEEMLKQIPYLEPMVQAFGIAALRKDGYEADDIIATLTEQYKNTHDVLIVSSDKDLMQLIDDNVSLLDTMKDLTISYDGVMQKFGVTPNKVTEVQALIGDTSDNVPGVPGVGPKTAAQLMDEFGSLEDILEQAESIKRPKLRENIINNKELALISHKLVTLCKDVPLTVSDDLLTFTPNPDGAVNFLKDMSFNRLTERARKIFSKSAENGDIEVSDDSVAASAPLESVYYTVDTPRKLKAWIGKLQKADYFAIDTETDSLNAMQANLVGISLSVKEGEGAYIPLTHEVDMLSGEAQQLDKAEVLAALKPILADDTIKKVGHNLKYDMHILRHEGVELNGIEDTMLMSASLYGGLHGHSMDELAERYLGHTCISFKDVAGTGKKQVTFDKVAIDVATKYAAEDADITLRMYHLFKSQLEKAENAGVKRVYEEIERPLVHTLLNMEEDGVLIDKAGLAELSQEFLTRLKACEQTIFALAGEEFNVNSPKQLGEVLFDKLGLKAGKKRSTNAATLEKLAEEHDIVNEVLKYRGLSKLRSTYTEALAEEINPKTGRVHTSYHQLGAATGRFSSSDPNLQNIPSRSEDGRKIRKMFIAKPNCVLMCADYSQIELRLLAHMSASEGLQTAFKEGHDIHAYTARQIFDVPAEVDITPAQRSAAKAINFGLVYGMGKYSLSKTLNVSVAEAQLYIDNYFARYSGVRRYLEGFKEFAHENGYVETMFGRRIHVPNINASNGMLKAGAERAAINAPLQGANADIIKMVMPKLEKTLLDGGYEAKILMQVHDELVLEVPKVEVEKVSAIVKGVMSSIVQLDVPLDVGLDTAQNWEESH